MMNATPMEQVLEIVGEGIKMPHKSTYFHPKIASGLVMSIAAWVVIALALAAALWP